MPIWKQWLMHLYYYGTLPYRWRRNAREAAAGRAPAMVLMYHRVADDLATPWTVSNDIFARQIAWLRDHFEIVPLAVAQERIAGGENHEPCVCITFDDGYADNGHAALPLLIKERIPCTYFVATDFVLQQRPFPHDVARGFEFRPHTAEELRLLSDSGIELGGHTKSHANLGAIDDEQTLHDEIFGGIHVLQRITGRPVRYFAFPYGQHVNLHPRAFALAQERGLAGVCSAYGGFNFPGDDPFHLQRFAVDNDLIRLENWTTVDPRKLRLHPRYEYAAQ